MKNIFKEYNEFRNYILTNKLNNSIKPKFDKSNIISITKQHFYIKKNDKIYDIDANDFEYTFDIFKLLTNINKFNLLLFFIFLVKIKKLKYLFEDKFLIEGKAIINSRGKIIFEKDIHITELLSLSENSYVALKSNLCFFRSNFKINKNNISLVKKIILRNLQYKRLFRIYKIKNKFISFDDKTLFIYDSNGILIYSFSKRSTDYVEINKMFDNKMLKNNLLNITKYQILNLKSLQLYELYSDTSLNQKENKCLDLETLEIINFSNRYDICFFDNVNTSSKLIYKKSIFSINEIENSEDKIGVIILNNNLYLSNTLINSFSYLEAKILNKKLKDKKIIDKIIKEDKTLNLYLNIW